MDRLLTLSLTLLTSRTPPKIRKGLRQIECLLAQICLSSPSTRHPSTNTPSKRASLAPPPPPTGFQAVVPPASANHHTLHTLPHDAAYTTFHKLQTHITYNIPTHLLSVLNSLLSTKSHPQSVIHPLIAQTLDLLLGLLLLHPPSRSMFQRRGNMDLLLDLLDPEDMPGAVLCGSVRILTVSLLGEAQVTRVFEEAGGLETLGSLLRAIDRSASGKDAQEVKSAVQDFLALYLSPEAPASAAGAGVQSKTPASTPTPTPSSRRPSTSSTQSQAQAQAQSQQPQKISETLTSTGTSTSSSTSGSEAACAISTSMLEAQAVTRSTREKQALLSRHIGDVQGLIGKVSRSGGVALEVS